MSLYLSRENHRCCTVHYLWPANWEHWLWFIGNRPAAWTLTYWVNYNVNYGLQLVMETKIMYQRPTLNKNIRSLCTTCLAPLMSKLWCGPIPIDEGYSLWGEGRLPPTCNCDEVVGPLPLNYCSKKDTTTFIVRILIKPH